MCGNRDMGLDPVLRVLLVVVLPLALAGCHSPHATVPSALRIAIQERAHTVIDQAIFLKPEPQGTNVMSMAPLILQEVTPQRPAPPLPDHVFTWTQHGKINGRSVEQRIYVWNYPHERPPAQGVRMTLNQNGQPILWEVLRDLSAIRVIYVAQSLEAEAMKAFPAPLPGHRFWIEPNDNEVPPVVIAGVLDETPVPMGPIVYLSANNADILTILCRCMDAQARELVDTRTYSLTDLDRLSGQASRTSIVRDILPAAGVWLNPDEDSHFLRIFVSP